MRIVRTQKSAWRHFNKRLGERYGIYNMTFQEWQGLMQQAVKAHTRHFVGRSSNTKTWWLLDYKKGQILALYCSKTSALLSCLPLSKLVKALNGTPTIRKYLGMEESNVMLTKYKAGLNPIRVNLTPIELRIPVESQENEQSLVDESTNSATVVLSETNTEEAEDAQADRSAGTEECEQGAEAAQLPGD